jgi:hypothetical protein
MYSSFYVRPAAGEQVQTAVSLTPDPRPALLGTVTSSAGKPVADALVVLTASGKTAPDRVVGTEYTDAFGQFSFGPLEAGMLYQVRISRTDRRLRTLEQTPAEPG